MCTCVCTSTPELPFKETQIPSNGVYKALKRGTLGGLGICRYVYLFAPNVGLQEALARRHAADVERAKLEYAARR